MKKVESAVRDYLKHMAKIRGTGSATSENSYYPALGNLLNELLEPNVVCIGQPQDQGKGRPDFGLYGKKQCSNGTPSSGLGEIPRHGVVEVKPLSDDIRKIAKSDQVAKYFERYRLVLVTNYREFLLIGDDGDGNRVERELFSLAADESAFWSMAKHPLKAARKHGAYLGEFLRRVMMSAAPLRLPEDVAWFLASCARDALTKMKEDDGEALPPFRAVLETALGIRFDGEKGEHFFRSTLVQTLFYGIFSAWLVRDHSRDTQGKGFDWRSAAHTLTVPMVQSLFEEVARPTRLAPLGLIDILDRTGDVLNRVDRAAFFESFDAGDAVQHFYEPFLKEFDPELRKQMGVWYTPPEIVRYMVERVDAVLRSELGIADGLADKNVHVLDPCCGTGAYVVEALRRIEKTLRTKGDDALIGQKVKEAARERVHGFEIMSAPFVIAHWRVGNLLAEMNAPLDPKKRERPAIYLTNALTGWEPPEGPKATLPLFPELEKERDQAEEVKRDAPILVVIGNPPYNAFAGTSPDEEGDLVEAYKEGLVDEWGIKKFNLDDLYVRFFRIAERRIGRTGRGIVSYISNYSWTSEPSYVVMRRRLLHSFDKFWIENMHGDLKRIKSSPDGTNSQSIFTTDFSEGIKQGVVVSLAVKTGNAGEGKIVRYRDDINAGRAVARRRQLLDSLKDAHLDDRYEIADPRPWNWLSFRPRGADNVYLEWPKLPDLATLDPLNGLMEKRGGGLIDIDRELLAARMKVYFDKDVDWEEFRQTENPLARDAARYDAKSTREKALAMTSFRNESIVRYIVRPFDVRHAYFTSVRPVWNEMRPALWAQYSGGNKFLMSRRSGVANPEGPPVFFTHCLGDNDAQRGHSYYFPLQRHDPAQDMLAGATKANLSKTARAWLAALGLPDPDADPEVAAMPWRHALAIAWSPRYLADNADGIAIDWPRVPLPGDRELLEASSALGARIEALLDTETDVPGVTNGDVAEHLRDLGRISGTDLSVTAGWGRRIGGKVIPRRGRTETRGWTKTEKERLGDHLNLLGRAVDVYLNETTSWTGVPEAVWKFVVGGYPVIKKWLSYREKSVLDRPLATDEAWEVKALVRRLTALVLLGDELDANYVACRDGAYDWPRREG